MKEIYQNFFIGKFYDYSEMVLKHKVDILVPLDSLDSDVWGIGFKGEIIYIPIKDFGVLPIEVVERKTDLLVEKLKEGKRIGMFCIGGHGRTGYMAAIILGKLGVEDPIKLLRTEYCEEAIESFAQIDQISKILKKPELIKHHSFIFSRYGHYSYLFDDHYPTHKRDETCGTCGMFVERGKFFGQTKYGDCFVDEHRCLSNDTACGSWFDEKEVK